MTAVERLVVTWNAAVLVVCVAVGAAAWGTAAREGGLTRAQAEETVRAHNAWRNRVSVPPLRWSADLAARAQARAEDLAARGCAMEHGPLPADVGENLFRAGPLHGSGRKDEFFSVTPTQVVDMWGEESADYSREHDTCAWNRECGHYTQIVWRTTREVGCGMSVCQTLGQVWVCNYRPRGNVRTRR